MQTEPLYKFPFFYPEFLVKLVITVALKATPPAGFADVIQPIEVQEYGAG